MMKLQSHTTSNPTSISQKAAIEALPGSQDSVPGDAGRISQAPRFCGRAAARDSRREDRRAQGRVLRLSEHLGWRSGNGITSAMQFSEKLLAEAHVAVVPGEAFGTDEHVRISYATSMKELERGLDRIERVHSGIAERKPGRNGSREGGDGRPAAHAATREERGASRVEKSGSMPRKSCRY